ncbi:MAG: DMT family transporter [Myxococcales bacterium]|nr:DMT family transporter [Myxococcales bacterium]
MNLSFGLGELSSILCALFWAVAVILFRKSGATTPPLILNLWKNLFGLLLFGATLLLLGISWTGQASEADLSRLIVSGAIGIGISDTIFFASLNRLGASRFAVVDCLYAPLVALCSFLFLAEPVKATLLFALMLVVPAVWLGAWEPRREPIERGQLLSGIALGALALLLAAIGIVLAKPALDRVDPWWAAAVRLLAGTALVIPQALWPSQRTALRRAFTPGRHWLLLGAAAFMGTYVAMFFWILGVKHTYATIASLLNQLSVIFMVLLAAAFLRERLHWRRTLAVGLGVAGAVLAML